MRQLRRAALLCLLASLALAASVPVVFGTPQRAINVHWRGVRPAERAALERQFLLADATPIAGDVWRYVPGDTSPAALRRLLAHPAVAETDGIEVRALRMGSSPPLTPRRGGLLDPAPRGLARATQLLAVLLAFSAAACAGLSFLHSPRWASSGARQRLDRWRRDPAEALRALPRAAARLLERGVPEASPAAAGLFRIALGAAVLLYLRTESIDTSLLRSPLASDAAGPFGAVLGWLAAARGVADNLSPWLAVTGLLFVAGVATRITFALFVAGFLLWASVFTLAITAHAIAALAVTLIGLLAAPWGDAWSVDAWLRRRRGWTPPPASRAYGFAIWMPRLALGVAFLAAAWSKVGGGPGWILTGAVKYHFVSDLDYAMVPWGPALTGWHGVAVLMSAFAVVVEALVITAAFSRSDRYVGAAGALALMLLAGFALFQGVLWWGWWMLLLAFLPWPRLGAAAAPAAARARQLRPAQVAAAGLLIAQQIVVSALSLEARPFLSAYDMYSTTYASPEEYEASINLEYRVVLYEEGVRRDLPHCTLDDATARLLPAAAAGGAPERERIRFALGGCLAAPPADAALVFEGDRRVYDWERGRFEWRRALDVIGPVPADWLTG